MKKTRVERPDGRYLYYYSFDAPPPDVCLQQEPATDDGNQIELRWNALLGDWVIVSTGRQDRTFLPPAEACPLCPTADDAAFVTELPSTGYEIAVFENRFPSFRPAAPGTTDESAEHRRSAALGACEVIVYSPRHDATFAGLPAAQLSRLVDVWADRYAELATRSDVAYVFIFENRGKEIGVTLTHPHGQIYAFPFMPPRVEAEQRAAAAHHASVGRCLMCDLIAAELKHGGRVVVEVDGFVAYVPFAARVPYEVHIAPVAHRPSLLELSSGQRGRLADLLRRVQTIYDALWGIPMPYTMSMHQRATDGVPRPGEHLHIEFMPPYRSRGRLKYLAGVETGAGTFINDTAPEAKAAELRAVASRL